MLSLGVRKGGPRWHFGDAKQVPRRAGGSRSDVVTRYTTVTYGTRSATDRRLDGGGMLPHRNTVLPSGNVPAPRGSVGAAECSEKQLAYPLV
jgi:hypothetical protein